MRNSRRGFLKKSLMVPAATTLAGMSGFATAAEKVNRDANDRPRIGAIGMRYQGSVITEKALPYGDLVAICDVDRHVREQARASFGGGARLHEDYRGLLDQKDIDAVLIGTPDHWHAKMVIDACRAGKDIYVEKPLTLTIDEGKLLAKVVEETGRVVQVGTWQRSDVRFRQACEIARSGMLGKIKRAEVVIDGNPTGGPFDNVPTPKHINWNLWLGQAPFVPFCEERCHYTFRWWFEYSGGKMTDWGAHHVDIALWGLGADRSGPVHIDARADIPTIENGYNTPSHFDAKLRFADGAELSIKSRGTIGVRFEGEKGSVFVTRGAIGSEPAAILKESPLARDDYQLYAYDLNFQPKVGKLESIENHMRNFFDCIRTRQTPISDVVSQHRSVSACHLANIAMRLGRSLDWDPISEKFVGDAEANQWLSRPQRKGFEVV